MKATSETMFLGSEFEMFILCRNEYAGMSVPHRMKITADERTIMYFSTQRAKRRFH